MQIRGYFDNCATAKPCENAVKRMNEALSDTWGNPSSLYDFGVKSENLLKQTREKIAEIVGARADEVFFTSSGTFANNLAIFGAAEALKRRGNRIVTTETEHASVLEPISELERRGFEIIRLPVDQTGLVSATNIQKAITKDTVLVSMMLVNNEIGTIQNVKAAAQAIKIANAPALLHCDCVQAFTKLPFKTNDIGADLITISAHKIHGVAGVGALIKRKSARILPITFGGAQESGLAPGTQSTALIAAFLGAMEQPQNHEKITALRNHTLQNLQKISGVKINSSETSSPYIINLSLSGIRSETMLHFLAESGIYVSSGSACSKGKGSHVLKAIGLSKDDIDSAIRISFSRYNTQGEADLLCERILEATQKLRRR